MSTIAVKIDPAGAQAGARVVRREMDDIKRAASAMERQTQQMTRSFQMFGRALAALGIGLTIRELVSMADAYTNIQNRVRTVTDSTAQLTRATSELLAIANRTRTSFAGTAEVFARVGLAARELGVTQRQLLEFTESLNQAVILSGASAAEAQAGMIQLSQGLASGALRGDELRSVLEQLPAVADVISRRLGITRGELRKMGEEGKITAEIVLDAFAAAREELANRFADSVPTVGQAFTVLRNSIIGAVGRLDQASGASETLARRLLALADSIDEVTDTLTGMGRSLQPVLDFIRGVDAGLQDANTQLGQFNQALDDVADGLGNIVLRTADILSLGGLGRILGFDDTQLSRDYIERIEEMFGEMREAGSSARGMQMFYDALMNAGEAADGATRNVRSLTDAEQDAIKEAQDFNQSLRDQIREIQMGAQAWELYRNMRDAALAPTEGLRQEGFGLALDLSVFQEAQRIQDEIDAKVAEMADHVREMIDRRNEAAAAIIPEFNIEAANAYLDVLREVDAQTRSAAQGMAEAFGGVGQAIGDLTVAFSSYAVEQSALQIRMNEQIEAGILSRKEAEDQYLRASSQAQMRHYGDIAGAAKNFFDEQSSAYKALAAIEKAYRAVQMAMAIQAMVMDARETASSVANATARGTADAAAGASKMFAMLGPFAFPAVAAMVAVLAGLGLKGLSGGGGGASFVTAEQQQARQGTGTVLGDSEAQSQSLARALDAADSYRNADLEYSSQMVRSLRAIESNIGAVATVLARQLGVSGGPFDTASLGLGTSSNMLFGGVPLLGSLFGSKTTRELIDQGIEFGVQSVAQIIAQGISGSTYQDVSTTKTKKFLGLTYSNKTTLSTTRGALDGDLSGQLGALVESLRDGVLAAAGALGVEGARATLDAMTVSIGRLSLEGLSGSEIEEALRAVFGKVADEMAAGVVPAVLELQKVGEGAFETLTRLARTYQVVDVALKSLGKTFDLVGVASLGARQRLVDLFGGIEEFIEATDAFAESFLSDDQRIAPVAAAVSAEMERLGLGAISTKEQFAELVGMIDVSTAAGAELYAAMLQVAPAFAKVRDHIEEIAQAEEARLVTLGGQLQAAEDAVARARAELAALAEQGLSNAQAALRAAYNEQVRSLTETIERFSAFRASLADFRAELDRMSRIGPAASYAAARGEFSAISAAARGGDASAQAGFIEAARRLQEASLRSSATMADYQRDLSFIRRETDALQTAASEQISVAEQQLAQLEASVSGLIEVRDAVVTVADAIAAARAAQAVVEATQVQQAQSAQTLAEQSLATAIQNRDLAAAAYVAQQQIVAETRNLAATDSGNWASALATFEQQRASIQMQGDLLREQIKQGYALSEAALAQARDLHAAETAYAGALSQAAKADAWVRLQIEQQQAAALFSAESAFAQALATGAAQQSKAQFDMQQKTAYELFNAAQAAAEQRSVAERVTTYNAGIQSAAASMAAAGQTNAAVMNAAEISRSAIYGAHAGTQSAIYGATANLGALLSGALARIEARLAANDNTAPVAAGLTSAQKIAALNARDPAALAAYLAANPDVAAAVPAQLTGKGPAYLQSLGYEASDLGVAAYHWEHYGRNEGRLFATGAAFLGQGVFQRPTSFDMGLMAERGPEAILPLANVGGQLGVRAVNDNGEVVAELRRLNAQVERQERILRAIAGHTSKTADRSDKTFDLFDRMSDGGVALAVETRTEAAA